MSMLYIYLAKVSALLFRALLNCTDCPFLTKSSSICEFPLHGDPFFDSILKTAISSVPAYLTHFRYQYETLRSKGCCESVRFLVFHLSRADLYAQRTIPRHRLLRQKVIQ